MHALRRQSSVRSETALPISDSRLHQPLATLSTCGREKLPRRSASTRQRSRSIRRTQSIRRPGGSTVAGMAAALSVGLSTGLATSKTSTSAAPSSSGNNNNNGSHSFGFGMEAVNLISRMYAAGEINMPPPSALQSLPRRTVHTLYAFSFMIYLMDVVAGWTHIWLACQGYSTNFALESWFVSTLVIICMSGSICNVVLMVLCIENAFTTRSPWDPFAHGCELICDEFGAWLTNFTCFRIAFLMLVLFDAPLVFCNFWFVSSCRIASGGVQMWPIIWSAGANMFSLLWRLLMLYFAYRHFSFFKTGPRQLTRINRESSTVEELKNKVGMAAPERMHEFDECWPVRYSYQQTMGTSVTVDSLFGYASDDSLEDGTGTRTVAVANRRTHHPHRLPAMTCLCGRAVRACCCGVMCVLLYLGLCCTGCTPCCHHYVCKPQSVVHRNRFAKTCTRMTTTGYHMFILLFSFVLSMTCVIMNGVLLSSVHAIGPNNVPPELSKLCIALDTNEKVIWPFFKPNFAKMEVDPNFKHVECVDVMDNVRYGFGFMRQEPSAWKLRRILRADSLLTMWTDILFKPKRIQLHFDFTVKSGLNGCFHREASGWRLKQTVPKYPWPYFCACMPSYEILPSGSLRCNASQLVLNNQPARKPYLIN